MDLSLDLSDVADSSVQNTFLQLTPSTNGPHSRTTTTTKPRRDTVSTACERCRRRKTKCSGLPGPCANCARLNVPCHDPGRRKNHPHGTLEDRIQRLKALTAANRYDPSQYQFQNPNDYNWMGRFSLESLQMSDLQMAEGGNTQSDSSLSHKPWSGTTIGTTNDVACGSGTFHPSNSQHMQDWMNCAALGVDTTDVAFKSTHFLDNCSVDACPADMPNPAMAISDMPSTYQNFITSTGEPSFANHIQPGDVDRTQCETPLGFTISYDSPSPNDSDAETCDSDDATPPCSGQHANGSSSALLTRASSPVFHHVEDRTKSAGSLLTRCQTEPALRPNLSRQAILDGSHLLGLIIHSTTTQKYVEKYIVSIHEEYPFLDLTTLKSYQPLTACFPMLGHDPIQNQAMIYFQILLTAAIGALIQHKATDLPSQYIKQAMAIQDQFDTWSSVGGLHSGLLLALYCYLAQIRCKGTEQQFSVDGCPVKNLWLYNCQIAAACIDLDLHKPLAVQEQIRPQLQTERCREICYNTIRSACVLDCRISELRSRPRAFHKDSIDSALLVGL